MAEKSCLYVIELEPDKDPKAKWYVGVSKNPDHRYQQHKCGGGAEWVARNTAIGHYKISWYPERIIRKMERHLTAALVDAYGRKSTRGAKYLTENVRTCPTPTTDAMPKKMAYGLRESGNEELARIATKPRFHLSIEKTFRTDKEALDWAREHLDESVPIELSQPIDPRSLEMPVGDWP